MIPKQTQASQRTAVVFQCTGLIVPFALTIYWWLVRSHHVDTSHYAGDITLFTIILPWLAIAVTQFVAPSLYLSTLTFRFICYHILGAAYILFVSGFGLPFFILWVLLFIACYFYFSYIGFGASIVTFIVCLLLDMIFYSNTTPDMIISVFAMFAVLIVGMVVVLVGRAQQIDKGELLDSKQQELLHKDRTLTLMNNLTDAVLSTDSDGVIRVYNASSLNLLDTNTSLDGAPIDSVINLKDQNGKKVSLRALLKQAHSVVIRDDLIMNVENDSIRLEITLSPVRSSYSQSKKQQREDGYLLILRDITKSKSLEEERDEFISVVSHELRTPITVAEGTLSNLQLLIDRATLTKPALKQNVDTAHEQVLFLARMVNDLSTLSRAERGVADAAEKIDVQQLVNDLYKEYGPQATKKGLTFNLDIGPNPGSVMASELYLKELLQNFITNSIKYTKQGSLTLRINRDKNDKILFEVKDTGIGISKSDQAKVFEKFYRSEDYRTRETGGTGLGLYVAAKLSRKLNTRITMLSRLNHGSSFSFVLPATKSEK